MACGHLGAPLANQQPVPQTGVAVCVGMNVRLRGGEEEEMGTKNTSDSHGDKQARSRKAKSVTKILGTDFQPGGNCGGASGGEMKKIGNLVAAVP